MGEVPLYYGSNPTQQPRMSFREGLARLAPIRQKCQDGGKKVSMGGGRDVRAEACVVMMSFSSLLSLQVLEGP